MGSDDIIGLYERHARESVGDRSQQTAFFEKDWLDRFTALVPAGGTVLDLGCGPGKPMAAYLLGQGLDVCGVDSSPTMIVLAVANFPDRRWIVADMRRLALGKRFAGVMAWDSFFHLSFEDQRRMFPIFRDHAAPGAPLLFTSGPRHGEAIGSLRGEPLFHASLAPDEYRSLLAANDFSVIAEKMDDAECGGHSVWLARRGE
jgi:SAM-dependent methyltransferase